MADNDNPETDENEIIALRRAHLQELREAGVAFPNDFRRKQLAEELHAAHADNDKAVLEAESHSASVAGRIVLRRMMGKASFVTLQDSSGRIQLYVRQDALGDDAYEEFKRLDIGDIVGVEGTMMRTNKGELTVSASMVRLLTKSLRPLPDKHRGLTDTETRYRQRYLDLMVNDESREIFLRRTQIVDGIRRFFVDRGYMEVETPMMQTMPGGATAAPFITHYNALGIDMYLRVAPELNLKRLVVGGFERVFEINRNFRNEGMSTKHSPEFTMLEFYQAYADYHDLMDMTEVLLREVTSSVLGTTSFTYQNTPLDFGQPFRRVTLSEAILDYNPGIEASDLESRESLVRVAERSGIEVQSGWGAGKLLMELFEELVEDRITQPLFVTAHPAEISPLARRSDEEPEFTDRFELFVMGKEIANGFSELNDPEDQAQRFQAQAVAREAGDEEAMSYDEDYVTALEYGLPPTAGEGIGIDRLVMMLTDQPSIRDVVLFPHMRPRNV